MRHHHIQFVHIIIALAWTATCVLSALPQLPASALPAGLEHSNPVFSCSGSAASSSLCQLGLAHARLSFVTRYKPIAAIQPPWKKRTGAKGRALAAKGKTKEPSELHMPITVDVWLRAVHELNAAGNVTTKIHALVWVQPVHGFEKEGHTNKLIQPQALRFAEWQPELLLQPAPNDGAAEPAVPVHHRLKPVDFDIKYLGHTAPWALEATIPGALDIVRVSAEAAPVRLHEVWLPSVHSRCPLPETHQGKPAMYIMVRPLRQRFNSSHGMSATSYGRLLAFHAEHHMRLGFAGYIVFVNPKHGRLLQTMPRVWQLVKAGFLRLMVWSDTPLHYDVVLDPPNYDQRVMNNVVNLALRFCAPGVRFAGLDMDELFVTQQPGATIPGLWDQCYSENKATLMFPMLNTGIRPVPDSACQPPTTSAGGAARALLASQKKKSSRTGPSPSPPMTTEQCKLVVDEELIWGDRSTLPAEGCHPLCYYDIIDKGELYYTERLNKKMDGRTHAVTKFFSASPGEVKGKFEVILYFTHNSWTGRRVLLPASCGYVAHINNMYSLRKQWAVLAADMLPFSPWMYHSQNASSVGSDDEGTGGSNTSAASTLSHAQRFQRCDACPPVLQFVYREPKP